MKYEDWLNDIEKHMGHNFRDSLENAIIITGNIVFGGLAFVECLSALFICYDVLMEGEFWRLLLLIPLVVLGFISCFVLCLLND